MTKYFPGYSHVTYNVLSGKYGTSCSYIRRMTCVYMFALNLQFILSWSGPRLLRRRHRRCTVWRQCQQETGRSSCGGGREVISCSCSSTFDLSALTRLASAAAVVTKAPLRCPQHHFPPPACSAERASHHRQHVPNNSLAVCRRRHCWPRAGPALGSPGTWPRVCSGLEWPGEDASMCIHAARGAELENAGHARNTRIGNVTAAHFWRCSDGIRILPCCRLLPLNHHFSSIALIVSCFCSSLVPPRLPSNMCFTIFPLWNSLSAGAAGTPSATESTMLPFDPRLTQLRPRTGLLKAKVALACRTLGNILPGVVVVPFRLSA